MEIVCQDIPGILGIQTISGHESVAKDRVNPGLNKNMMKSNALWNLGYICLSNVQIKTSI